MLQHTFYNTTTTETKQPIKRQAQTKTQSVFLAHKTICKKNQTITTHYPFLSVLIKYGKKKVELARFLKSIHLFVIVYNS